MDKGDIAELVAFAGSISMGRLHFFNKINLDFTQKICSLLTIKLNNLASSVLFLFDSK